MTYLNKFENLADCESGDPRLEVASAWAEVEVDFVRRFNFISNLLARRDELHEAGQVMQPEETNAIKETEERLFSNMQAHFDEFDVAFSALKGRHIGWRQYIRGEVVTTEASITDQGVSTVRLIRSEPQYPRWTGWIKGAASTLRNPTTCDPAVLVEVASSPSDEQGVLMNFATMFDVAIEPQKIK